MNAIPGLRIRRQAREADGGHPNTDHTLTYRSAAHEHLPHVVKFSGGRSSAMLLFTLLENRILKQERGDVVVFNNTACEHPETYRFTAECKKTGGEDLRNPRLPRRVPDIRRRAPRPVAPPTLARRLGITVPRAPNCSLAMAGFLATVDKAAAIFQDTACGGLGAAVHERHPGRVDSVR